MKKIYLLWIPVLCLLWRCNENDHMTWKSKGGSILKIILKKPIVCNIRFGSPVWNGIHSN